MSSNVTKFEHACFISYKHPPKTAGENHFYREFVIEFRKRLEYFLKSNLRSYLDDDIDPGGSYPPELARNLCTSVCMVAVLVPEYPDSSWCWAEWQAMEKLEALRLKGQRGLIIPIALRRSPNEWDNLLKRKPIDFSNVFVPKSQLDSVSYSKKIEEIADIILKFVSQVNETCENCGDFELTVGIEQLTPTPTFPDPDPFA